MKESEITVYNQPYEFLSWFAISIVTPPIEMLNGKFSITCKTQVESKS